MVVVIDNYDSFIYNLVRYVSELGYGIQVFRNDAITIKNLAKLNPEAIIISPGPCTPKDAGISVGIIQELGDKLPILGVCLGHQAIGQAYDGRIVHSIQPMHGKSCWIHHSQTSIFNNLENPMQVGRYHSLAIERETLPEALEIIATSEEGEIMAVKHRKNPIFGVQFHPESVLTPNGKMLLKNFLLLI